MLLSSKTINSVKIEPINVLLTALSSSANSDNASVNHNRTKIQGELKVLFDLVKLFTSRNLKIARESLNIETTDQEGRPHEWRRLVGSIRRRVQRHASSSGSQETPSTTTTGNVSPLQPISRKNSLTQSRLVGLPSYFVNDIMKLMFLEKGKFNILEHYSEFVNIVNQYFLFPQH